MRVILRNTQQIIIHVNTNLQIFVILGINECTEKLWKNSLQKRFFKSFINCKNVELMT